MQRTTPQRTARIDELTEQLASLTQQAAVYREQGSLRNRSRAVALEALAKEARRLVNGERR